MSYKVAFASGKGGTGKTLLSTNIAYYFTNVLKKKILMVDLDVEEPNSSIFLNGELLNTEVSYREIPYFDADKCNNCNICKDICNFNALIKTKTSVLIFKNLCHGCGVCTRFCPQNALVMSKTRTGVINEIKSKYGFLLIEGVLDLNEEMTSPIIDATKKKAEILAEGNDFIIIDSPPGTSCSYVESIKDVDHVIIITEPTLFGKHDSTKAIEIAQRIGKDISIVINRGYDDNDDLIEYYKNLGIETIAVIKTNIKIAQIYSKAQIVYGNDEDFDTAIEKIAEFLLQKAEK